MLFDDFSIVAEKNNENIRKILHKRLINVCVSNLNINKDQFFFKFNLNKDIYKDENYCEYKFDMKRKKGYTDK